MKNNKKAIIVNGITDMNKGDQALVWESYRIIEDTGLFDEIAVISLGDTPEEYEALCGQTQARGFRVIKNIQKHPRRGKHHKNQLQKEGIGYLAFQMFNAVRDYVSLSFLVSICKNKGLTRLFFSKEINQTLEEFKAVDTIFFKGGGFLHAHGEVTAPYFMWYFLFYAKLGNKLNKNVVVLPNSYGPFEGLTVKSQMIKAFGKAKLLLARENISAVTLSKLLNRDIPVVPDLGFYLQSSDNAKGLAVLEKYGIKPGDKVIGITARPWRFPGQENPTALFEKYVNSLKDLIVFLTKKGYKVALFNQSIGPNAHEDDRNAIEQLVEATDNNNTHLFTWVNENLTCDVLKAVYSNLYFFVGTRFHSLIFSMTSEIPSVSIAYGGNKGVGIMKDFDLAEYVVHINDIESATLINQFEKAISEYDSIKEKLHNKLPVLKSQREETINLIRNAIA